ncbi:hypothetical protein LJB77_03180, partial [Ruminococcaceae bacterium OttesenSCG-928-N02]|nr:hypothetical protein [Ruminococcaceae bacterium OttesenSCG-928-N02]
MTDTSQMIFFFLALAGGTLLLQVFLSKKQSKWPGLALPLISIAYSLITVLGLVFYTMSPFETILVTCLCTFLITNIPTIIFLAIYFACREKIREKGEM